jgi:hypothetical protein
MGLSEIKNELIKLNNQLENKLTLKGINFEKATGTTLILKDVITSKTNFKFDKFTHYVIKDEKYDEEILYLQKEINAWEKLFFEEIERLIKYEELPLIIFLKEEEKWKWWEIDKVLHYAEGGARLKYYRSKKNEIDTL